MEIYNPTGVPLNDVYGVIYGLENRDDHKIYIGKTTQKVSKRISNHKIAKTYIGNAIRYHGLEKFFIVVVEVCNNKEQLNQREKYWIARLSCRDPYGYNLTDGGENPPSMKGRKFSKKTRDQMSASHKGKKRPPEVCAKISASKKGKPRSDETKAKLSVSRKGKPPANKGKSASAEAIARMSAAKKGKPSNRKGKKHTAEARARMSASRKIYLMAVALLKDLGGKPNIVDVTNCATRLRVTVKDDSLVADVGTFNEHGAHGLVHNGRAIQVIVGLSVPQVRERFEALLNSSDPEPVSPAPAPATSAPASVNTGEHVEIKAVVSGKVIDMSEVPDEMFSQKMMGDGVAIEPSANTIKAPADAEITMIMDDSKHAVGLRFKNGAEMLIHIGIDTVNLKGEGFELLTKQGAKVKVGDPLVKIDRDVIKKAGYKDVVVMALTNSADFPQMKKETGKKVKVAQDTVISV